MQVDVQKIRAEMQEHWGMSAEMFDSCKAGEVFTDSPGDGFEMSFVNAAGDEMFWVECNGECEVWHTNFHSESDDHTVVVTEQLNFGKNAAPKTFRISALVHWFTTSESEVEAMMKQFNETGSWEQRKG